MPRHRETHYLPQDPKERMAILAAVLTGLFVFGDDINRWVARQKESLRSAFQEKMPIDVEIERAREMAVSLMPDLRRNHEAIVREQVETETLRAEVHSDRARLQKQKEALLLMRAQLESGKTTPVSTDTVRSHGALRDRLRTAFESYQASEDALKTREQVLGFREEALSRAEASQKAMLLKKEKLELEVRQLESRVQLIRRRGVDSQMTVDQEKLTRCEELLSHLKKRLTIAERVSKFDDRSEQNFGRFHDSDSPETTSVEQDIDRYFQADSN